MGTNYYEQCCECHAERHIGKSSAGWPFAVRTYDEDTVRIASWADWIRRLRKLSTRIVDEYGREHSLHDLRGLVASKGHTLEDREFS